MSRSRTCRALQALGFTIALSPGAALAEPTPQARPTSLDEAISIAMRQSPDVLSRQAEVAEAEAQRAEVRGQFGPRLHVDAGMQLWNSAFDIPFGAPGAGGAAPLFRVRDAFTWSVSPSLIQPITPLFAIYDQYKVQDIGVDVATIKRQATRRDVAFQVVQDYYRLLEAQRLAEVADASVVQLEAQQRSAQSRYDNGVIGKNDLLRAQLAVASAKQRAIDVRGHIEIARGALDTAMGLPPDAPFEPVPFEGGPPAPADVTLASAENLAVTQRLEVREIDKKIDQASHGVAYAKKKLLPQLSAIGNYTHFEGSPLQQTNAAYVGLFASWDVWDWGSTLSGVKEANAKADQVRAARKKVEDQVRLEARQAFIEAQTARDALDVAQTAVSQAEENYRIVSKKFETSAATSFDVVDAEALLTQSRAQVQRALYDLLIARAALRRATGEPLEGQR